jgi:3-deoxy-7-phosphoheptulonate synthase
LIIVMKRGATPEQVAHAEERVREAGLVPHTIHGVERDVVAAVGDERPYSAEYFEVIPGVEKVLAVLAPYKLASSEVRPEPTTVRVRKAEFGAKGICVIAGPCTVESRGQVLETAHAVKEAGAVALRGGAFKPRTNPYSFQGLHLEGLELLALAREETGLPVVTEVMSADEVPLVARYADVLQIGTRNMQNFPLLRAVGQLRKPVVLKRGMWATLEEFLLAAEYVLSQGNGELILCERGIRTFERYTRNTLALAAVPVLKEKTHLPVIVDPSHGTGRSLLVPPMCKAAIAAGADGLMVEVCPDPERALLDGEQSLDLKGFDRLMKELKPVAEAVGRGLDLPSGQG